MYIAQLVHFFHVSFYLGDISMRLFFCCFPSPFIVEVVDVFQRKFSSREINQKVVARVRLRQMLLLNWHFNGTCSILNFFEVSTWKWKIWKNCFKWAIYISSKFQNLNMTVLQNPENYFKFAISNCTHGFGKIVVLFKNR